MGFMTGQQIYENFTDGIGPEGLSGSAAMVNELAAEYQDEGDAIRRLTVTMDAVWQGEAAGAAQRGAGPVAVEHELAAPHMATAQDLNSRQAGSFADARNAVVPVPPEPTAPDPWAVFTSPVAEASYRQQVADYNTANQHNVEVMTGYTGASSYNSKGMPQSYGALSDDQAGIVIDPGTSDPGGGPRDGGRGAVEWSDRGSGWVAPPSDAGGPAGSGGATPPDGQGGPGPQVTAPGGFTPAPSGPPTPVPVGTGGGVGSGPPSGGPASGFAPVGGGPGVPGSEVRGPGGRARGGEPHAAARGGAGGAVGRGGALGGMPMAAGGRGRGEDDIERSAPEYLREDDPEALFGTDEPTAPPVIGEEPDDPPGAG